MADPPLLVFPGCDGTGTANSCENHFSKDVRRSGCTFSMSHWTTVWVIDDNREEDFGDTKTKAVSGTKNTVVLS